MIAADEFYSIYSHGLVRVAACTLPVAPANPMDNARRTAELIRECDLEGVALAAFPEPGRALKRPGMRGRTPALSSIRFLWQTGFHG